MLGPNAARRNRSSPHSAPHRRWPWSLWRVPLAARDPSGQGARRTPLLARQRGGRRQSQLRFFAVQVVLERRVNLPTAALGDVRGREVAQEEIECAPLLSRLCGVVLLVHHEVPSGVEDRAEQLRIAYLEDSAIIALLLARDGVQDDGDALVVDERHLVGAHLGLRYELAAARATSGGQALVVGHCHDIAGEAERLAATKESAPRNGGALQLFDAAAGAHRLAHSPEERGM